MKVVECIELTKVYGRSRALNNLSFSIEENKITGLIGRNGAGKTTLFKNNGWFSFIIHQVDIRVFEKTPFNNLKVSANSIFIDNE